MNNNTNSRCSNPLDNLELDMAYAYATTAFETIAEYAPNSAELADARRHVRQIHWVVLLHEEFGDRAQTLYDPAKIRQALTALAAIEKTVTV